MKLIRILPMAAFAVILSLGQGRAQYNSNDKNTADYWLYRTSDPNVNYFDLVSEFDAYWQGKTPDKNSGYKLFKRWQDMVKPYVGQNGTIRSPQEDILEYKKFIMENPGDDFSGTWSLVGPTEIPAPYFGNQFPGLGRVSALAFHPTDPDILFAGSPLGGLWKSTDGGQSWTNWHTDELDVVGVSDIAINYVDPDIIYLGTGDRDGGSGWGAGVYKSTDGGYTWAKKSTGMVPGKVVAKLLIHPQFPNRLLAAASDGIYESSNNGENWYLSLPLGGRVKDMVSKPGESYTVYVCNGSLVYKTTDFGLNWGNSILTTDADRLAMAVTPADPEKLYVLSTKGSMFYKIHVSVNSGGNFSSPAFSTGMGNEGQGDYNLDLAVDPEDPNTLYAGMINVFKSINGGLNWYMIASAGTLHADQHVFEISPHTSDYLFIGNDGGVYKMEIGGMFHPVYPISSGLAITQVMRLATSATNPDFLITGMQDCGSFVTNGSSWLHRLPGDGMNCAIDYSDPMVLYGSAQKGHIFRSTNGGNSFEDVAGTGINGINQPGGWYSPFVLDQFDPAVMFAGYKDVWRTNNVLAGNPVWTNISAGQLGDKILDVIEQSPVDGNYMFIADEGGMRIYYTIFAKGSNPGWTEVAKPASWYNFEVNAIEAHPTDKNIFYFSMKSRVCKYSISSQQWTDLTGDLPDVSKLSIVYQTGSDEGLYVGTTAGVYYKDADMPGWVLFNSGLPLTNVKDLEINYHTDPPQLFAGTFGRGIWKTDVYPSPKPNLVAIGGNSTVSGTQVSILCTFQNQSQLSATTPFQIGYYLSMNELITPYDILIGQQSMPETGSMIIGQGNLAPLNVGLIVPDIPPGTYYMGAYLDHLNQVFESSETDNAYLAPNQVTIPAPPDAPLNVQASDGIAGVINVQWDVPPSGANYYAVYRNTVDDPSTAVMLTGSTWTYLTYYDDFTAPQGLTVYYWVKASYYPQGQRPSAFSTFDIGWIPCSPPANVQATDGLFNDKVVITWEAPPAGTFYKVFRSTSNNSSTAMSISGLNWVNSTSFSDVTANYGTTYYYWVKTSISVFGLRASGFSSSNSGWMAFANAPVADASDGLYNDRIEVSWNSVIGANYYQLFRNTVDNPLTSQSITGWQAETTFNDYGIAVPGALYYYWVKASQSYLGTNPTGFGLGDQGWMNLASPANVQASDGTLQEIVNISWNPVDGASWYQIYRSFNQLWINASPVSLWVGGSEYLDSVPLPGKDYYYWVLAAADTMTRIGPRSSYNIGWGYISAPEVSATKGIYPEKVAVTWQPVNGAETYRVFRLEEGSPSEDPLTEWSSDLDFLYEDYSVTQGITYSYSVKAARNTYGSRESAAGVDQGFADECGNLAEDLAYRSVNFHGTTLELTQRVYNEGPHALLEESQLAFALEAAPPFGSPGVILGYANIPPLAMNEYFDVSFSVALETLPGWPLAYGTWYVSCFMPWESGNCETNPEDDYIVWEDQPFEFTDALYGTYTIAPNTGDFYSISKALLALETRGISDQVVFHILPGIYFEQLVFPEISGASEQKTVTFQKHPGFADTAEIKFTPDAFANYTLLFAGSAHLVFNELKITTTGFSNYQSNYGRVIEFAGNCRDIRIMNCKITGYANSEFRNYDNAVIFCSNSNNSGVQIKNNRIMHGFAGIYLEGMDLENDPLEATVIESNHITGFYQDGIRLKFADQMVIKGNTISYQSIDMIQAFGIFVEKARNGFEISGNRILMNPSGGPVWGIRLTDVNTDNTTTGFVLNNFISIHGNINNCYGIMVTEINKTRICNNSIHLFGIPGDFSTNMLMDCSNSTGQPYDNTLFNNILSNVLNGYCLIYNPNAINYQFLAESDHNNFYSTGTHLFLFGSSYGMPTLSEWYDETGLDPNSVSLNPFFLSDTDVNVNSELMDDLGIPLAYVPLDIEGDLRDLVHPDIGADEYSFTPFSLDLKVFLEGPFFGSGMHVDLAVAGLVPLAQPYFEYPWNYPGPESVSALPGNIIDWVLVELRDAPAATEASSSTIIVRYAAFLRKDGKIVGTDGSSLLQFSNNINHQLFVVIRHRNHLGIMAAAPLVRWGYTYTYDFTTGTGQAFGDSDGYKQWEPGLAVLVAGDGNADGLISPDDKEDIWAPRAGKKGYLGGDFNMDGQVNNSDKNLYWYLNNDYGYFMQVPD